MPERGWSGAPGSIAPALLRSTSLWLGGEDFRARPALPVELFKVMGLGVGQQCGAMRAREAGKITCRDAQRLAGTAMHCVAVGTVFLFAMATV